MKPTAAAACALALMTAGAALNPARAWGYNQQRCWIEVHYYEKNWGGCFPQQRNSSGQVIHLCCG
jgi:hypothetical protein